MELSYSMYFRNVIAAFVLSLSAVCAAQIAATPDTTNEPAVFEQVSNRIRFENDGSGEKVSVAVVRVQSEAAVQDLGQLIFGYNSA
ncbi:MAG TPA: hypothetical protein VH640_11870, partial [Bryobacteraceae bacterium]